MRLLSLDLGITTGFAVLSPSGGIFAYGDLLNEDIEPLQFKLAAIKDVWKPTHVCVEKPLIVGRNQLARDLERVVRNCLFVWPHPVEITPAQWKQTPFRAEPCPRGASPHARDAIRLGLYYLSSLKAT